LLYIIVEQRGMEEASEHSKESYSTHSNGMNELTVVIELGLNGMNESNE
jgi:hypothetical protein